VKLSLSGEISGVRIGSAIKQSEVLLATVDRDARFEFVAMPLNTLHLRRRVGAWPTLVLSVYRRGNFAQIAPCVVAAAAISVINLKLGPFAGNPQPYHAVHHVLTPVKFNA